MLLVNKGGSAIGMATEEWELAEDKTNRNWVRGPQQPDISTLRLCIGNLDQIVMGKMSGLRWERRDGPKFYATFKFRAGAFERAADFRRANLRKVLFFLNIDGKTW